MSPPSPGPASALAARIVDEVSKVLEGKRHVVEMATTALVARGHLLIEDVPGVGKTTLARALARVVGAPFRRVQFTSDLLPADVLGGSVYDQTTRALTFRPGPIFTSVLLADEVNRATPRTQSALLEAMEEGQVSIEGETRPLPSPFFVVATQNPEELHGTYPLPESQLDRFILRIEIGHPPREVERHVLRTRTSVDPVASVPVLLDEAGLRGLAEAAEAVRLDDLVLDYLHEIVVGTRESSLLVMGASTRAALAMVRAVRARALVLGRAFAIPDDVKDLAVPVLAHRVRPRDDLGRTNAMRAVREVVDRVPVPV